MKKNITLIALFLSSFFYQKSFSQVIYPCGVYYLGLNGTTDYGAWSKVYPTNDFTLAAWVQITDPVWQGKEMDIFQRSVGGIGNQDGLDLYIAVDGTFKFRVYTFKNGVPTLDSLSTGIKPDPKKWYHVAVTFQSSGNCNIYINGNLASSKSFGGAMSLNYPYLDYLAIGCKVIYPGGYKIVTFKGYLDELAVAEKALTQDQIKTLANGLTAGDPFFVANRVDSYDKEDTYPARTNLGIGGGSVAITGQLYYCNYKPPIANAGPDQTITLPITTVTLSGSVTLGTGTIAKAVWSKESGPAGGNISDPGSQTPVITNLQEGTYIFKLTLTDNNGYVGTDEVSIIVNLAKPEQKIFYYNNKNGDAGNWTELTYNNLTDNIKVAADSSTSTLIKAVIPNANKCIIRIKENSATDYSTDYGLLKFYKVNNDSVWYLFNHPSNPRIATGTYSRLVHLEVYNTTTNNVILVDNIGFVRPPVLLIHGVWSSVETIKSMESYLLNSGEYKDYQIRKIWFPNDIHDEPKNSAESYQNIVPHFGIDNLLLQCIENGLSAGKVNIVGHSRGGLLARYYLQSSFVPYRNDVNSLITVNTPHWGSQGANIMFDDRNLTTNFTLGQIAQSIGLTKNDKVNGAWELRVNSETINNILDKLENTKKNNVPCHAIVSTYKLSLTRQALLGAGIGLTTGLSGLRMWLSLLGSACSSVDINDCVNLLFNEDNDLVVPLSSQKGGMPDAYVTNLGNGIAHSKKNLYITTPPQVMEEIVTHQKVAELFNQDPNNSPKFIKRGFRPAVGPTENPKYTFLPSLHRQLNGRPLAATVTIDKLINGSSYQFGDTVKLRTDASIDVTSVLIVYESQSFPDSYSDVSSGSSTIFKFPIPKIALGRVNITAYGFNSGGLVAVDSSYITIGIPASVKLDSIRLARNDVNYLEVPAKDSIGYSLLGYYSDTVRDITYQTGISYSFKQGGFASISQPNYLKGLIPNKIDTLTVNYLGKMDSIEVRVIDSVPRILVTLPVALSYFNGVYKNDKVNLYWATSSESNNKEFEIEYSNDGTNYKWIGTVPGKGSIDILSNYFYATDIFSIGNNYYRLKQVDLDGNFRYSIIIAINISSQNINPISIFPNPTRKDVSVWIKMNIPGRINLQLNSSTGQSVFNKNIGGNPGNYKLELPALTKGLYIMTILVNKKKKVLVQKLIIE